MKRCSRGNKRRYRNHAHAVEALHLVSGKQPRNSGKHPSRVYFCVNCKGWHLTSRREAA